MGIHPDIIVLRTDEKIEDVNIFRKIANFCNVKPDCVMRTTLFLFYTELLLCSATPVLIPSCAASFTLPQQSLILPEWQTLVDKIRSRDKVTRIGLVGKYVQLHDAYLSVAEALQHAGYEHGARVDIEWIDSETVTDDNYESVLKGLNGIIVPGGFGSRGIEGMILTARYARENNVPYLGICLGYRLP